nr:unnamed protein product [Digitaria exilis]
MALFHSPQHAFSSLLPLAILVAELVGHGGHEAGLAGARRVVLRGSVRSASKPSASVHGGAPDPTGNRDQSPPGTKESTLVVVVAEGEAETGHVASQIEEAVLDVDEEGGG